LAMGPPPDIASVVGGVPTDLAAIVRKAMGNAPADRYPSARELAADLRRFQTGQLVSVRNYRTAEVLARWVMRHKAAFTIAFISLGVIMGLAGFSVQQIVAERNRAQNGELQAQAARSEVEKNNLELTLLQARTALDHDPTAALAWLLRHPGGEAMAQLRSLAADAVSRGVSTHVFRSHSGRVTGLAFGPNEHTVISGGADGQLLEYDLRTRAVTRLIEPTGQLWQTLRFPDGKTFATIAGDGQVEVVTLGTPGRGLVVDDPPVLRLAASPDGTQLAAGTVKGRLWIWNLATGARRDLPSHPTEIRALSFSSDGRRLISASFDGTARMTEVETGHHVEVPVKDPELQVAALSPDGELLATAALKGTIHLWDSKGRLVRELEGHSARVIDLRFAADGRLASASADRSVRIWSPPWGAAKVLEGHGADVLRLAWSPDATRLASAGTDATVRLWEPESGASMRLSGHQAFVSELAFSPDGMRLASAGQDGSVRVWPVPPRTKWIRGADSEVRLSPKGTALVGLTPSKEMVKFGPLEPPAQPAAGAGPWTIIDFVDDQQVLAIDGAHEARLWNIDTAALTSLGKVEAGMGSAVLAQGWLVAGAWDGTLRAWRLGTVEARSLPAHRTYTLATVAAPDGKTIASAGDEGVVRVWTPGPWTSVPHPPLSGPIHRLRFSETGQYLASGDIHGQMRVWDLASHQAVIEDRDPGFVRAFAFTHDGKWVASAGDGNGVQLRGLKGQKKRVLMGPEQSVLSLEFSPDDAYLAVGSGDGAVRVYELATGAVRVLRGHIGKVERVRFVEGGQRLISVDSKGGVRQWARAELAPPPADPKELQDWMRGVTTVEIDAVLVPRTRVKTGE
jgi:eukaryotic-like serine/threonine-protein kinase